MGFFYISYFETILNYLKTSYLSMNYMHRSRYDSRHIFLDKSPLHVNIVFLKYNLTQSQLLGTCLECEPVLTSDDRLGKPRFRTRTSGTPRAFHRKTPRKRSINILKNGGYPVGGVIRRKSTIVICCKK